MKIPFLIPLAFTFLSGLDAPKDDPKLVEKEYAKIQGTWKQVSGRANGEDLPAALIGGPRVTFKGNKKSVKAGNLDIVSDVLVELDPLADPKIWDETVNTASGKIVIRGIYKLDGDTLTRCIAPADEARPKEFVSKKGNGHTLQVFQRVKSDSKP